MDLSEAIDCGDATYLDNTEFTDTDAVPLNTPLPTAHYLVDEVTLLCFIVFCLCLETPLIKKVTRVRNDLLYVTLFNDNSRHERDQDLYSRY